MYFIYYVTFRFLKWLFEGSGSIPKRVSDLRPFLAYYDKLFGPLKPISGTRRIYAAETWI